MSPDALVDSIMQKGDAFNEDAFQRAYGAYANKLGLSTNPDDPMHFYDYRAAYKAGVLAPDGSGHLTSQFKLPGHPRLYSNREETEFSDTPKPGWIDTRTGRIVK